MPNCDQSSPCPCSVSTNDYICICSLEIQPLGICINIYLECMILLILHIKGKINKHWEGWKRPIACALRPEFLNQRRTSGCERAGTEGAGGEVSLRDRAPALTPLPAAAPCDMHMGTHCLKNSTAWQHGQLWEKVCWLFTNALPLF